MPAPSPRLSRTPESTAHDGSALGPLTSAVPCWRRRASGNDRSPWLPTDTVGVAASSPHNVARSTGLRTDCRFATFRGATYGVGRSFSSSPPRPARTPPHTASDNRLTAVADVDLLILHNDPLRAFRFQFLEHQAGILLDIHHPGRGIRVAGDFARLETGFRAALE